MIQPKKEKKDSTGNDNNNNNNNNCGIIPEQLRTETDRKKSKSGREKK
jgi:hypothetical protein